MGLKRKTFSTVLGGTVTGTDAIEGINLALRSWTPQEGEEVLGVVASVVINSYTQTEGIGGFFFNLSQSGEWLGAGSLGYYKATINSGTAEDSIQSCHLFEWFGDDPIDVLEGDALYLHVNYLKAGVGQCNCDYDIVIFYRHKR